jgi:hypothetical protein
LKTNLWIVVLQAFVPLTVRTILYLAAFKFRRIDIKLLSCIIIAGSAYLVGAVPLPLPELIRYAMSIGLAMFLMTRYTEAEIFPDVILIPVVVQLSSPVLEGAISNLIFS